jgi:hypothetical protein
MKKFLKILIFLIVLVLLGAIVYQFRSPLSAQLAPALENIQNNISAILPQPAPCRAPIPYNIGTFDTQFGISQDYFLSALADAEAIWDKPFGKEFFTYAPTDTNADVLKINLVYDYRQQATGELANLGIVVQNDKASYDSLKIKYTALQSEYNTAKEALNTQVNDFNQKQQAYEAEVSSWNKKGGAPQAVFDELQTEKSELQAEASRLNNSQTNLNAMADELNALAVALNHLVATLNLSVANYNSTIGSSLGESFEEGVYVSDGTNRYINIYEFSNRDKLVRALAHELGHALGLDHVTDPNAIMYKLNQGTGLALTQADINELKVKCGIK